MNAGKAKQAMEVLLEQERVLRFEKFGADEALELGVAAAKAAYELGHGVSVTVTREADGLVMLQWVADDCSERNLLFANGKRAAARKAGHASPWAQLEATISGEDAVAAVWANVPAEVPACGAFPIRVEEEWVATLAVSGLMEGLDHEVILRALERVLGTTVARWEAPVA